MYLNRQELGEACGLSGREGKSGRRSKIFQNTDGSVMGALQDLYAAPQSGNNIPATLNANKPAVATNVAQAQIADRQRNGEGSELAHAARLSEIVCIASGHCRQKFQDRRSRRSLPAASEPENALDAQGRLNPNDTNIPSVLLRVN
jgi:hypothetical protein